MTISTTASNVLVAGDGSLTSFSFTFQTESDSDLISVTYVPATGSPTVLDPSQYTITFNAVASNQLWPTGGTITYPLTGSAIASGTYLLIERALPLTQDTSIRNQGNFYAQVTEEALDLIQMQLQQVATSVAFAPQVPLYFTGSIPEFIPPFTDGLFLAYDSNGNIVATEGGSGGGSGGGSVTSVGLTAPSEFTVSGSPITGSGTLTFTKVSQTANAVYAGPTTGSADTPIFRSLVAADISAIAAISVTNTDGTLVISPTNGNVVARLMSLTSGNLFVGSNTNVAYGVAMNGDGTLSNTGALTVTKTNGTLFGTMAVQNANSVSITGGAITGMSSPTSGSDVATKTYVDNAVSGTFQKNPCVSVNTTALTVTYANGALGVGATLTNNTTLAQFSTSDGITPNTSDRILIKGQGSTFQNGVYTVTQIGSGAVAWVLTRATDFDQAADIALGDYTLITSGTVYTGATFIQSTPGPFTMGVTGITFVQSQGAAQTITLTGDTTGTGAGSIATTIASNAVTTAKVINNAITNAKMNTGSTNTLAGYDNSGNFSSVGIGSGLSLAAGTLSSLSAVTSVSNSDSSITISPTTGAVVASLNVAHTNTWTASQVFTNAAGILVTLNNPNASHSTRAQGWYLDTASPGTGAAFNGRIQLGESTLNAFSQTAGTGSEWVEALSNATVRIAQLSSVNYTSGIGVLGASRTSDRSSASDQGTQGITGIVNNDNTTTVMTSYAGYYETWKQSTAQNDSIAQGIEVAVINKFSSTSTSLNVNPYSPSVAGMTEGIRIGGGKAGTSELEMSVAMSIVNVPAGTHTRFRRGINIASDAISAGSDGNQMAINMAQSHSIGWWIDSSNLGPKIRSDVSTAGDGVNLVFGNNTANITSPDGSVVLFGVSNTSNVGAMYLNTIQLLTGALVYKNASQSISTSTWTTVTFNASSYDDNSLWNSGSRLTVPTGVTRIKLSAQIYFDSLAASTGARITIQKNGTAFSTGTFIGQPIGRQGNVEAGSIEAISGVLAVTATDYFEVSVFQDSGSSVNIASSTKNQNASWFCMEIIK